MPLLKTAFWKKLKLYLACRGKSCQYTHFMSFPSKSEHDTIADQATLLGKLLLFQPDMICLIPLGKCVSWKGYKKMQKIQILILFESTIYMKSGRMPLNSSDSDQP